MLLPRSCWLAFAASGVGSFVSGQTPPPPTTAPTPATPAAPGKAAAPFDVVIVEGHRAVGNAVVPLAAGGSLVTGYVEDEQKRAELVATTVADDGTVGPLLRFRGEVSAWGWDTVPAPDAGSWVAGFATRASGGDDMLLLRVDSKGRIVNERYFGGGADDRCWAMTTASGDGVVLVGETASFGGGERDAWIVRTDAAGQELWQRTVGGAGTERVFGVACTDDGGVLTVGLQKENATAAPRALVVVLDGNGAVRQQRAFGPAGTIAHGLAKGPDGTFLVAGYIRSARGDHDAWFACLRADGSEVWQRTVADAAETRAMTCAVRVDGSGCAIGYTQQADHFDVFTLPFGKDGTPAAIEVRKNPGDDRGVDVGCATSGGLWCTGSFATERGSAWRVWRRL